MDLKHLVTDLQPTRSDLESGMIRELFLGERGRLRRHSFELATAIAWLFNGLTFLTSPSATFHSSVGHPVHPFDTIWSILYLVGAIATLTGLLRPMPALRVSGLTVMGTGMVMQAYASAEFDLEWRVLVPLVYAVACFVKAFTVGLLIQRSKRIYASHPHPHSQQSDQNG